MRPFRRGGALTGALALALGFCLLGGAARAAAERREQDCFCTGLWTCLARTGLPYSACDQEGMRVICCVRRQGAMPAPAVPPMMSPNFLPTAASSPPDGNEVGAVDDGEPARPPLARADLNTDANTHFRYSTGRPTGQPAAIPTTVIPGAHRHPVTALPTAFSTMAFTEDDDDGQDDGDGDGDEEEDAFPGTSTTARPPHSSTRSSAPVRARPPRPAARPFSVFVTPVPAQHAQHADSSAQEIEWDDGAPQANWSEEDAAERRRPGPGPGPQQREPKKIDWTNLSKRQHLSPTRPTRPTPAARPASPATPANLDVPWSSWDNCGVKGSKGADPGIDGVAEPSEWPWHAALLETASDRYVCGATLVGPSWLLTAAHCIVDYPDPTALKVRVGELDVRSDSESFTQERAVVQLVAHPAFDLPTLRHDIALVRIARPPRDYRNVAAVCLPPPARSARPLNNLVADDEDRPDQDADEGFPREGTVCIVTGWGRKDEMSPHSEVLKEVPVPVWSRGPCQEALRAHLGPSFRLPRTALCAGAKGRDACDGDGGGPLVCQNGGRWFQMGIVSYGIGCGRNNSPGVYTKMSSYTAWMRTVTGSLQSLDEALPAPHNARPKASSTPSTFSTPSSGATRPKGPAGPASTHTAPRNLAHHIAGPAVSRVRVNHYTGPSPTLTTTTARTPTRSVIVISAEREDGSVEDGEDVVNATTEQKIPSSTPSATTASTPTPSSPSTTTQRSSRVLHQPRATPTHGGAPSAGVSYFRSNYGSSGWNYPLEGPKASATNIAPQRVAVAPSQQPSKWYSPSYSGSYRGTVAGSRLPGQILSNVAGRTAAGLNRWYSPFYSGSYRGDYNAFPREDTGTITTTTTTTVAPAAYNVRPPLAAPRWYTPLHEQTGRWFTSFHNGTYRTGYDSGLGKQGKHRFAANNGENDKEADRTWTYLVKTGTQGTVITLDSANASTNANSNSSSGPTLRGEGTAGTALHPSVSESTRQGRTLVNFTNTFTYPSAQHAQHTQHAQHRNASSSPHAAGTSLSSSYSIYRIYPSVFRPSPSRGREAKAIETVNVAKPASSKELASIPETSRNSIVGYSHFSSGDTAVHFNITHDPLPSASASPSPSPSTTSILAERTTPSPVPQVPVGSLDEMSDDTTPDDVPVVTTIAALDLTTLRAATAEDSTMDMPPVVVISTTEAETNAPTATASPTALPTGPTDIVTTVSTESTTKDVLTTTETTTRGRGRARVSPSAEDDNVEGQRSVVSTLARRGGQQTADAENLFATRRHRPETTTTESARGPDGSNLNASPEGSPDNAWGDRTRRGRTQHAQHAQHATAQGVRGGRRLDVQVAEADGQPISTAAPRPRSRGRARTEVRQQQRQPVDAVSFVPRRPLVPTPATSVPRHSKDRAPLHPSPGLRHSKPVDVGDQPETVFVHTVHTAADHVDMASRAIRPRGRRPPSTPATSPAPSSTLALSPTPAQPAQPAQPEPTSSAVSVQPVQDEPEMPPFVAEVKPPRVRGRNRKSEPRRKPIPQHAALQVTQPEADVALPAQLHQPQQHQQQQQHRAYGKKPRKQLKKVSLASAEVQEVQSSDFTLSSPAPSPGQQHHPAWFPADEAVDGSLDSVMTDDGSVELREDRDEGAEDLEREDIYSFLSQRTTRRRSKAGSSAEDAALSAHPMPAPPPPTPTSRWGRKGAAASRRRAAVEE